MGLFSWLKKGKSFDSREILAKGEEWAVPEEWFVDGDGKKVRRKKKRGCCGCNCEIAPQPENQQIVASFILEDAIEDMMIKSEVKEGEEPVDICCLDMDYIIKNREVVSEDNPGPTVAQQMIQGFGELADSLEKSNQVSVPEVYSPPPPPTAYESSSYSNDTSTSNYDSSTSNYNSDSSNFDSGGSNFSSSSDF